MTGTDPRTDPDVRRAAQFAFDDVLSVAASIDDPTCREVVWRRCDSCGGLELPDPLPYGDVAGLLRHGEVWVLDRLCQVDDEPLQDTISEARRVVAEVREAVDTFQRSRYGVRWNPPPPGLTA